MNPGHIPVYEQDRRQLWRAGCTCGWKGAAMYVEPKYAVLSHDSHVADAKAA